MKHSRISQGSVESAAAEVAHPGYRMGDEEDGGDTLAYISRKSVKGKSMDTAFMKLARMPWSYVIVILLLITMFLGALHTSQVQTKMTTQRTAIMLMKERLEETAEELEEHRRESIHLRSDILDAKVASDKEHSANEKLRSEIGGLRSDIGGVMKQLKDKTAIADRIWLENNAFSARLLALEGEVQKSKNDIAKP